MKKKANPKKTASSKEPASKKNREEKSPPGRKAFSVVGIGASASGQKALRQSEEHYRSLFDNMMNGYAYCRMHFEDNRPVDFTYLRVNQAFEALTGLTDVEGKKVSEVIPGLRESDPQLFEIYGRVALTGVPERFETYVEALNMWFSISVYRPQKEHFVAIFDVITERKRAENIMLARLRLVKFAESHSLEEFTQAALDESEALTGSTIGFYHLVEADQRTLSLQSWSSNTLQHMCTAQGKGQHYGIAEAGVWVDCVHQRRPVIHNNYDALPHRKGMPPGHAPVMRELVVPISRANKIVAIIGVGNKPSDYDEWDVEAVSLLGDLSWDIAERKRAEEDLHRAKDELEQRVQERTTELSAANEQLLREAEERHLAEKQAESMGRLYRLLSRVNETIVRAQETKWLFRQACRIMMEEGDFLLCWIGRVEWEVGVVRSAAQYDLIDDYPQNITISLEDVPLGHGPTGVAVREGRWDVCVDIAADPRMAPWREQALARGFRSSAAFPLFVGGKVEGVLTLYSGQKAFFNPEEVEVLNFLAQDLSFAMESMDREAKRRQAEEEIRRLNEELERRVKERTAELEFANRELEAFSYSVSHDLKAPIRAIQGFSRMLVGEHAARLDAEGLRLLNVITSNTKTMDHLIDDLLALSRLGRHEIRKGSVNLTAMARQVFDRLRDQAPERDLRLTIGDLPPGLGDQSLLYQVMENLLGNAIKYTKTRKTAVIEVVGKDEENETIYSVKDNGIGFDERYAGKLFGVFQRLHRGEEYEGTGVGLAIVERIIQRHGGRVWAEGKVEEGATFSFALPKNGAMAK